MTASSGKQEEAKVTQHLAHLDYAFELGKFLHRAILQTAM
jgi:hypothetical protein